MKDYGRPKLNWEKLNEDIKKYGIRNATVCSIAPTGSISIIAGASSGIEPLFGISFMRNVLEGTRLFEVNPLFEKIAKEKGFYTSSLLEKIAKTGSIQGIKEIPKDIKKIFVTALDIEPEWHVKMQSAFQRYVDNAVSKCVTGGSWVFTENGQQQMKELYKGELPDTFSGRNIKMAGNPGVVEGKKFYFGGKQPVINLRNDLGINLGGTPIHRIIVLENGKLVWKDISNIKVGDVSVVLYNYKIFGNKHEFSSVYKKPFSFKKVTNTKLLKIPYKITVDLARLLGYIISDGSFHAENSVALTQEDKDIIKDFIDIIKKRFDLRSRIQKDKRTISTNNVVVNSRPLVRFLRDYLGIANSAENKTVPKIILRSGVEIQKEFIKGLTLDGYVSKKGRIIPLTTTSIELAQTVQMMLLNIGIPSRLTKKKISYIYKGKANEFAYEIAILSEFRNDFINRIGFAESRKNELAKRTIKIHSLSTSNVIPTVNKIVERLAIKKEKITISNSLYKELWILIKSIRRGHEPTRDKVLWLLDVCKEFKGTNEYKTLANLTKNNYVFSRVVDLKQGNDLVYDFHVPISNTFITNGLISHNTINLPNKATKNDVKKAFELAYRLKCKGITVYRYGCKSQQVLYVGEKHLTAEPEYSGGCPISFCSL